MKRLLLFLILALAAHGQILQGILGASSASAAVISGCSGAPSATGSSGCLNRETFQGSQQCVAGSAGFGSTCDNNGLFTFANNGSGNLTFSYTAAPLQGTRSLFLDNTSNDKAIATFAAQTTVYVGAMFKVSTVASDTDTVLQIEHTADSSHDCMVSLYGTGGTAVLQAQASGGTNQTATFTIAANTLYYIKAKYVAGSGLNAVCTAYLSTDGATWGETASSTNGTGTANVVTAFFYGWNLQGTKIVDDIRISTADFNYW